MSKADNTMSDQTTPLRRDRFCSMAAPSSLRRGRRTRSIYAPSPVPTFGPKACMVKVPKTQIMHVTDPASQKLTWQEKPLSVLIIKKIFDDKILEHFKELSTWLCKEKNMIVFVESAVMDDPKITDDTKFAAVKGKFATFREGDDLSNKVDLIICLGGDGTLLYASSLFQESSIPPVMAFHLGSLGFLTPFDFGEFKDSITNVLEGEAPITLRSRLKCIVVEDESDSTPEESDDSDSGVGMLSKKGSPTAVCQRQVLNEVVIDRGPAPYLSNLELYLDGRLITSVQGDGLIISTPTGSTAYAAAAGAAMCHPNVPAILITPICPHSLSFRPIVVPAGVELKVMVPSDARSTAWASFDGRNRQEICQGQKVKITTSRYPVASICRDDQISDWFDSLGECLHWNVRTRQGKTRQKNDSKEENDDK
ncbi:NAD kinase-like isoform X2 [Ptychodera flava]|uniref:NAD kinase-like isoform X2 n=2 Tax=Ptychodera flava TaxID=63121 RepID=UPI00396A71DA